MIEALNELIRLSFLLIGVAGAWSLVDTHWPEVWEKMRGVYR